LNQATTTLTLTVGIICHLCVRKDTSTFLHSPPRALNARAAFHAAFHFEVNHPWNAHELACACALPCAARPRLSSIRTISNACVMGGLECAQFTRQRFDADVLLHDRSPVLTVYHPPKSKRRNLVYLTSNSSCRL
jgi:hypothetical protein